MLQLEEEKKEPQSAPINRQMTTAEFAVVWLFYNQNITHALNPDTLTIYSVHSLLLKVVKGLGINLTKLLQV